MAFQYKRLCATTIITGSNVAVVTNGENETTYVRTVILFNYHATETVTVRLYNVPAGGSPGVGNQIFGTNVSGETNLDPGQTVIWEIPIPGLILETQGDTLQVSASTGSRANITVIGATE